jgi:hypothetical protein
MLRAPSRMPIADRSGAWQLSSGVPRRYVVSSAARVRAKAPIVVVVVIIVDCGCVSE